MKAAVTGAVTVGQSGNLRLVSGLPSCIRRPAPQVTAISLSVDPVDPLPHSSTAWTMPVRPRKRASGDRGVIVRNTEIRSYATKSNEDFDKGATVDPHKDGNEAPVASRTA
jgi:hypothetical protein